MADANDFMDNLDSVAKLIGDLALQVADAQDRMDTAYIKHLAKFAKTMAAVSKNKKLGNDMLGLFKSMAPARYQFTETVIETRADLQTTNMKEISVGVDLGYNTPVLAAAVNASYVKRSAYDYRASASIRTVLQAVSPDASLMTTLTNRASQITSPGVPEGRYKLLADAFDQFASTGSNELQKDTTAAAAAKPSG